MRLLSRLKIYNGEALSKGGRERLVRMTTMNQQGTRAHVLARLCFNYSRIVTHREAPDTIY